MGLESLKWLPYLAKWRFGLKPTGKHSRLSQFQWDGRRYSTWEGDTNDRQVLKKLSQCRQSRTPTGSTLTCERDCATFTCLPLWRGLFRLLNCTHINKNQKKRKKEPWIKEQMLMGQGFSVTRQAQQQHLGYFSAEWNRMCGGNLFLKFIWCPHIPSLISCLHTLAEKLGFLYSVPKPCVLKSLTITTGNMLFTLILHRPWCLELLFKSGYLEIKLARRRKVYFYQKQRGWTSVWDANPEKSQRIPPLLFHQGVWFIDEVPIRGFDWTSDYGGIQLRPPVCFIIARQSLASNPSLKH